MNVLGNFKEVLILFKDLLSNTYLLYILRAFFHAYTFSVIWFIFKDLDNNTIEKWT
jgi:hypothetical protein